MLNYLENDNKVHVVLKIIVTTNTLSLNSTGYFDTENNLISEE